MSRMTARIVGRFEVECRHEDSGATIITKAPARDGTENDFSPTDICAASLANCALTLMAILAERHNIDIAGVRVDVSKEMASDPSRIGKIEVIFHMPAHPYTDKEKATLRRAAEICPIHKSLAPEVEQVMEFRWNV